MTTAAAPKPTIRRAVLRLDLSGPQRLGFATLGALVALLGGAALTPIATGPTTTATGRVRAEPVQIRHADGGVVARLAVKDGDVVEAGAMIATLDARLIDSQIAGLKRQMDGIQMHVGGLKQEAEALAASDRQSTQRQRLAGLEAQIASSEQESLGLQVRLAMAEQEKARTDIRAPLAGRIVKVDVAELASVAPNGVVAALQPASDRLVLEATWPVAAVGDVRAGHTIAVWPRDAMPWAKAYAGRVERRTDSGAHARLAVVVELAGTGLDATDGRDGRDAARAFVLRIAGTDPSLLTSFLAPVLGASRITIPSLKASP